MMMMMMITGCLNNLRIVGICAFCFMCLFCTDLDALICYECQLVTGEGYSCCRRRVEYAGSWRFTAELVLKTRHSAGRWRRDAQTCRYIQLATQTTSEQLEHCQTYRTVNCELMSRRLYRRRRTRTFEKPDKSATCLRISDSLHRVNYLSFETLAVFFKLVKSFEFNERDQWLVCVWIHRRDAKANSCSALHQKYSILWNSARPGSMCEISPVGVESQNQKWWKKPRVRGNSAACPKVAIFPAGIKNPGDLWPRD